MNSNADARTIIRKRIRKRKRDSENPVIIVPCLVICILWAATPHLRASPIAQHQARTCAAISSSPGFLDSGHGHIYTRALSRNSALVYSTPLFKYAHAPNCCFGAQLLLGQVLRSSLGVQYLEGASEMPTPGTPPLALKQLAHCAITK